MHSGTELIPLFPYLRAGLLKGGGDVSIAPGKRLTTDHGLTGFPDLKANPDWAYSSDEVSLDCRLKFAIVSSHKSLVTSGSYSANVHWIGCINAIKLQI